MIENTSESMKDPANAMAFLAASLFPGGSDAVITGQEAAGQAQVVASDRLPTEYTGERAEYEALGFSFGEPGADPLFMPAVLPEGWTRQGSDHSMWSYVVDQLGRRRVGIFYKAAWNDRTASMSLKTVDAYVRDRAYAGEDIVTDNVWATPAAVRTAALVEVRRAEERITNMARYGDTEAGAQYRAERDAFAAIADRFETETDA
ncbi:hypothetical protein ACIOHE_39285 [Streptomyces sp. NPDC087851]|uniref:hypothetical protein n=1 Tax=Streptomyces sp. NPDC087851 TaxID=3365810 RepID=UPI0038144D36